MITKPVLIIGRDEDPCVRLLKDRLTRRGHEFIYLPETELFPGLRFSWELRAGASLGFTGFANRAAEFDQIGGVLARFSGIATSVEEHRTKDGQYLNSEWHALMRGYMHSLPCPVINRLRPELWYKARLSAVDLLSCVPNLEFHVPRTMITTKFEEARTFFGICGGRMRYSPLSLPANYLIESEEDVEKLEPLSKILPLYLSEAVAGDAVRAFVIGRDVLFQGNANPGVGRSCLAAADSLGLTFCELHLMKTSGDEWYCLEIKSMPYLFDCADETRAGIVDRLEGILCAVDGGKAA